MQRKNTLGNTLPTKILAIPLINTFPEVMVNIKNKINAKIRHGSIDDENDGTLSVTTTAEEVERAVFY